MALVFCSSDTWVSRIIRFFTRSEFSHVEFLDLETGLVYGSVPGEGVRISTIEKLSSESTKIKICNINKPYDRLQVIDRISSQVGKKYDWVAILGIVIRDPIQDPTRWICSELICWAFEPQLRLVVIPSFQATPETLMESSFIKCQS